MDALKKVHILVDPEDWHGHHSESLWASPTAMPTTFVVMNAPFFAGEISRLDHVDVEGRDGELWVVGIKLRGGHSTYRVIPTCVKGVISDIRPTLDELRVRGCGVEGGVIGNMPLFSIDLPKEVSADDVYMLLKAAEERGSLHLEVAHDGHP